ncbi:MAG: hypothetical protein M3R38_01180 [Actinomycetota bacterium]|nr:hypothetical protein [Actinomycetota bacterium]
MTPEQGSNPRNRPRNRAALAKRPPYWDGCEKKDFEGLVEFILDAVRRSGCVPALPRSEKELLDLWEMLREKYAAGLASGEHLATPPAKLQSREDKLSAKYARYWRLVDREQELHDTPVKKNKKKWQELRETEKKIEKVEREIAELGGSIDDHSYLPEPNVKQGAPVPVPWTLSDPRYRSLMEILGVIKGAFDPTARPLGRVAWEILPQGESSDGIRRLFEGLRRRGGLSGFDPERLDNALSLPFKRGYTGKSGFDGYVVFTYEHTHKVLLECPRVGNAAYVIGLPTERWSRMNKQELRADRSGEVCKINHRGDWERKVREALDLP